MEIFEIVWKFIELQWALLKSVWCVYDAASTFTPSGLFCLITGVPSILIVLISIVYKVSKKIKHR